MATRQFIGRPDISRTPDGRKRITRFANVVAPGTESANIASTLIAYNTADTHYTDCFLVDSKVESVGENGDKQRAVYVFEELPASGFVLVGAETVDTEINGLRRRTGVYVGKAAATDAAVTDGTVGTTTHATDTTLILAGVHVEANVSVKRVQLVWMEPGIVSKSRSKAEGGITQYTWVSVGSQQDPPGTVIAVSQSNPDGYAQWSVTSLANKDDEDLVGTAGAAKLAFQYQQFVTFPQPGTVDIEEYTVPDPGNGVTGAGIRLVQTPPVDIKVVADVFVFFQETATIEAGDKTYDSASGLWNPSSWPTLSSQYTPIGHSQVRQSEGFRGYRMADPSESPKTINVATNQVVLAWTNAVVFGTICAGGNGFAPTHSATLSGGPDDPTDERFVLDVDIRQAFEKADGTIVYKKVIVVATITPA